MTKNRQNLTRISVYYVALLLVWLFVEALFHSKFIASTDSGTYWFLQNGIKEGVLKVLIWLVPAIILIRKYRGNLRISLTEMFTNSVRWTHYVPVFIVFTLYIVGGAYLKQGSFHFAEGLIWQQFIYILFVGITEEMVFRGWLLNATVKDAGTKRQWQMIALNAVLFLVIHFPIWIYAGAFTQNFASFGFLAVMLLSVIFSYTFLKARNIVLPVLLHMYWDFLITLFYGA